jgi:hypothetical protein
MLRHLIKRLQQGRDTQLRRQFENALLYIRDLGDEQGERFGRGLNYLFNDWVERFGPVKDCKVQLRQHTVKEMRGGMHCVATRMTLAQRMRSNSSPTTSRHLICGAPTPRLSTI